MAALKNKLRKKIGVSPSIVSGYETGERTPSIEVLLSLSYLYNTSTDYLLGRQAPTPKAVIDVSGLSDKQVAAIIKLIESIRETN